MTRRSMALPLLCLLCALAVLAHWWLPGRSEMHGPDPARPRVLGRGGVDLSHHGLYLSDVYLQGPHGLRTGATAPLRLTLTNDNTTPDALVGVSSPVAVRSELTRDGRPAKTITLAPGGQRDLEWKAGVLFTDLHHPLHAGQWLPVTFTFAHAGTVTTDVEVGPLDQAAAHSAPTAEESR